MAKAIAQTQSSKFSFNIEDFKKVAKNAAIFAAPAIILFFTELQAGQNIEQATVALKIWAINIGIDFLKKFAAGK